MHNFCEIQRCCSKKNEDKVYWINFLIRLSLISFNTSSRNLKTCSQAVTYFPTDVRHKSQTNCFTVSASVFLCVVNHSIEGSNESILCINHFHRPTHTELHLSLMISERREFFFRPTCWLIVTKYENEKLVPHLIALKKTKEINRNAP